MYAHIINNQIVYTSQEDVESIEGAIRMKYNPSIKDPILYKEHIIERGTEYKFYQVILEKLINMDIGDLEAITKEDLYGESFTEQDIEYLRSKRMYPNGLEAKFTELMFLQATGNFSAGQELGAQMKEESDTIDSIKDILLGNK